MSYSTNPQLVVERMHDLLELKAGRACRWRVDPPTPHQTKLHAYRMREALYIAHEHAAAQFPELARAYEAFEIWYVEPGVVEARPSRGANISTNITNPSGEPARKMAPTVGLSLASEVTATWRKLQPTNDPISFKSTVLDVIELTKLWDFFEQDRKDCGLPKPRIMLLVGESQLTLAPWQDDAAAYAWRPKGATLPEETFDI